MTRTVNLSKKKVNLKQILSIVEEGNEIILTKNRRKVAKVVPLSKEKRERILGQFKGKIWTSDDFEKPIPEEEEYEEYWENNIGK